MKVDVKISVTNCTFNDLQLILIEVFFSNTKLFKLIVGFHIKFNFNIMTTGSTFIYERAASNDNASGNRADEALIDMTLLNETSSEEDIVQIKHKKSQDRTVVRGSKGKSSCAVNIFLF